MINQLGAGRCILVYFMSVLIWGCANDTKRIIDHGVPFALAKDRKQQVKSVSYELDFIIPRDHSRPIEAKLILNATLVSTAQSLVLDFKPNHEHSVKVKIAGKDIAVKQNNEHIIIPNDKLQAGDNRIEISFQAGDLSLNRNQDYLYTLLVPDRARTLFPCFDQPDIKAKFLLHLTTPKDWKVLSSSSIVHRQETAKGIKHSFALSDLMSTYLFSFVTGIFKKEQRGNHLLLHRETDSVKIGKSIDPIFKLHEESLDYLEKYTTVDFPFQKFDFVAIPGFQYGGMEHIGAVQYRSSSLFLDQSASTNQQLNRAKLIAHETAHMWFGNLVTMKWFDDVWLKEVFANFMADKIVNPSFPEVNHQLQFLLGHYPAAYSVDRTQGTHPIKQPLENLNNAGTLYGRIIYDKAPIMMRQLELVLGKSQFKQGLQDYLKKYAHSNASWHDLISILDGYTDEDLHRWSETWVNQSSRPIFSYQIKLNKEDRIAAFSLSQKAEDGSDKVWPQKFSIKLIYKDSVVEKMVELDDKKVKLKVFNGYSRPNDIIFNSDGLGYGVFPMSKQLTLKNYNVENEVSRAQNYINIFENAVGGRLNSQVVMQSFVNGLENEKSEMVLYAITSNVKNMFWHYLDQDQRNIWLPKINKILWDRLMSKSNSKLKKAIFGLYSSMAYKGQDLNRLYNIWQKNIVIDNLELNQDQYTQIAMNLALYKHQNTELILKTAKQNIFNKDRLRRFEFISSALSPNNEERKAFFNAFSEEKNRARENWVATACYYIHHPLRQKEAIEYLPLSLELIDEIQRTGDIFFPTAWLNNTIGLYNSAEAKNILDTFLEQHKNLNPQLVSKILQATDPLTRYQVIVSESL